MKRYVDLTFRDKNIRLYCTMNAALDIEETYDMPLGELFQGSKKEVFERECYVISMLSYEGKALFNNDDLQGLSLSELNTVMPFEMSELVGAMFEAIALGYKREIEPEEVDEGLIELKKKKSRKESKEQK